MRRSAILVAALAFLSDAGAQGFYGHLYEPGALPLKEVIGMDVVTPAGHRLGKITDLVLDPASGSVEEIAVGSARYPLSTLVSGDAPGGLVVLEPPGEASAGAGALLPLAAGKSLSAGRSYFRASRDLGLSEETTVDLRAGRVQPGR